MIQFLIILVIVGFILYLVENYVPMSPPFKTVFRVIVVIVLIFWLLQVSGLYTGTHFGRLN